MLFPEYFPDEDGNPYTPSSGDAGTDFDYSGVEFGTPAESEMEILERMLADDSVTVDGTFLEGPDAQQVHMEGDELPPLPPPRAFDIGEIEQDTEWV